MFNFLKRRKRDEQADAQPEEAVTQEVAQPVRAGVAPAPLVPQRAPEQRPQPVVDSARQRAEDERMQREIEAEQRAQQQQIEQSLQSTRRGFFGQIANLFAADEITPDMWDELQDLLVLGDCGVDTTNYVLDELERQVNRMRVKRTSEAYNILKQIMVTVLEQPLQKHRPIWADGKTMPHPYVIMVVGVNGTGKTTTIAKLSRYFQRLGQDVLLGAADTFRAAAIEQLGIWAERVGVPMIRHKQDADPGAVVFDAVAAAISRDADILIIDTAGRLHTKVNLMEELRKLRRISEKQLPGSPHDMLLVIDATTGQNGLQQAKVFTEAVNVTGVVLTKLDSTAKGGIAFAIARDLGLPIRFIGTGEKLEALAEFDAKQFVNALFE